MAKTNRFNPDNARDNLFRKPVKVNPKLVTQHTGYLMAKFAKVLTKPANQPEAR